MSQLLEYLPETEKDYYKKALIKYKPNRYFAQFNWSAFLFGNLWMFYRKMYSVGLGIASIDFTHNEINKKFFNDNIYITVILTFLLHIMVGFYGTSFYGEFLYKKMKKGKNIPLPTTCNTCLCLLLTIFALIMTIK